MRTSEKPRCITTAVLCTEYVTSKSVTAAHSRSNQHPSCGHRPGHCPDRSGFAFGVITDRKTKHQVTTRPFTTPHHTIPYHGSSANQKSPILNPPSSQPRLNEHFSTSSHISQTKTYAPMQLHNKRALIFTTFNTSKSKERATTPRTQPQPPPTRAPRPPRAFSPQGILS